MTVGATETTVTFKRSFSLPELDQPQPAWTCRVITDEEEISGLSFVAFRCIATMLRFPSLPTAGRREETVNIDANEFSTALTADEKSR
ncbi:hypothetical protein QM467_12290 [Rhodoblastus sp. 17X3]|uniref:hypothetical protein n=1 Tax=Rhodoblastus sp. 17X3 TaxID=3047026 RepID=UPI0024B7C06C|nr:hypothetical protein [Rhodoblastus sp. 17X3]MDI9848837.1 hypothetical protein [Rhodoblastus sp. 17X3]